MIKVIIDFREPFNIKRNEEGIRVFAFEVKEGLGLYFVKLPFLLILFIFFRFDIVILRKVGLMVLILNIKISVIDLIDGLALRIF